MCNEFREHPSKELQDLFRCRPFQIQEPEKAKIIFLSLDANWDPKIKDKQPEYFKDTLEYLEDGVKYWKSRKGLYYPRLLRYTEGGYDWIDDGEYVVHTPMLRYTREEVGDGRQYHERFSKLGFSPEWADKICFMELLNICTCGNSQGENRGRFMEKFMEMLECSSDEDKKHVERIQMVFSKKIVCIPGRVREIIDRRDVRRILGVYSSRKNIIPHTHFSYISEPQTIELRIKIDNALRDLES